MIDRCPYNSHALVNDSWLEAGEGGSMHVRRMAKDALDENVSNFTSSPILLARVEPPFVHFPAFDPRFSRLFAPSSPHLSSSTFI